MSSTPKWLPHAGGIKRRGLDIGADGTIQWAACNNGDIRKTSVFLNQPGCTLAAAPANVVKVEYGKKPIEGRHPVEISSLMAGKAEVSATTKDGKVAKLALEVYPAVNLTIAFKAVRTDGWKSTFSANKALRLMKNVNYIYSYQGNLRFSMLGSVTEQYIPALPAVVPTDDIVKWDDYRDCSADITVFFVRNNDALGVSWKDLIMMEDTQPPPYDEMTFAHECGHRVGLPHPDPPLKSNLMNQTSVGDRHRMRIYLTRNQIERITNRSNWNRTSLKDAVVCVVKNLI
jgi:hypothetical protein